ncbi:MAG: tRNA lysidine(34) synthetase TilS [Microvirga sp.]|nr:tRNA lysidine(34) synthetase TilS [Microvirga sp.]
MAPVSPPDDPFSKEGLERLFSSLNEASGILAAVSGGPDSMALMHGLARWAAIGQRPPIHVATIDHGLRPEAAEEAAFVAREAALLSLPHRTLSWTGQKPMAGIQEAARKARYRLGSGTCGRSWVFRSRIFSISAEETAGISSPTRRTWTSAMPGSAGVN